MYLMMRIPQLGDDTVRLRFISFSLKDLGKKWLYSLAADSVTTWDDLVKAFLKKFTQFTKLPSLERISCISGKNRVNYFGDTLSDSKIS